MTTATAIAKMPTWPRRMQYDLAASYCGVSASKFHTQVRSGRFPEGSKDGGNVFWYIEDLDTALDNIKAVGEKSTVDGADWMESLDHDKN